MSCCCNCFYMRKRTPLSPLDHVLSSARMCVRGQLNTATTYRKKATIAAAKERPPAALRTAAPVWTAGGGLVPDAGGPFGGEGGGGGGADDGPTGTAVFEMVLVLPLVISLVTTTLDGFGGGEP